MPKAPAQHSITSGATKTTRKQKPRDRRASARERGYSAAWDKFSKAFLIANPLCEFCLASGAIKPARVTDHDLPHEQNPDLFWDNTFTALCVKCHSGVKQSLEARCSGDDLLRAIARLKAPTGAK